MAKQNKGYTIAVSGEYYSRDPSTGKKGNKFYEKEEFILPEIVTFVSGREKKETIVDGRAVSETVPRVKKMNALRCGLAVIKNFHIKDRLKEKYEDFTDIRTCEIFYTSDLEDISKKKIADVTDVPVKDMKLSHLRQFVLIQDLNLNLDTYNDLGTMKKAVQIALKQKQKDDKLAHKSKAMSAEEMDLTAPGEETEVDPLANLL